MSIYILFLHSHVHLLPAVAPLPSLFSLLSPTTVVTATATVNVASVHTNYHVFNVLSSSTASSLQPPHLSPPTSLHRHRPSHHRFSPPLSSSPSSKRDLERSTKKARSTSSLTTTVIVTVELKTKKKKKKW